MAVPFLIFVVPRIYFSLHPDPIINTRGKVDMDPRIRWRVPVAMLLGFTGCSSGCCRCEVRLGAPANAERVRALTRQAA